MKVTQFVSHIHLKNIFHFFFFILSAKYETEIKALNKQQQQQAADHMKDLGDIATSAGNYLYCSYVYGYVNKEDIFCYFKQKTSKEPYPKFDLNVIRFVHPIHFNNVSTFSYL